MIWDEGTSVSMDGVQPFTKQPVALVGTAEKGYQSVQITVSSPGGHSSKPPIDGSSVGSRLGRILTAISASPPSPKLVPPTLDLLKGLAPLASAWMSPLLMAVGLVPYADNLLAHIMAAASAEAAALVRSTAAVTKVTAGIADNVLPQTGMINVNFRLLPGDTPDTAVEYAKSWLGRDSPFANVTIAHKMNKPQAKVTDATGPHFGLVKAAIQLAWRFDGPQGEQPVNVLPILMPGRHMF
eukprot:GHRR01033460.1.p1 GENE.GHRR01033460.1~~GHRR01033460.1.p1  ORF type:complete len:240 (+),score=87.11 GHRR01033460.1:328-1047(+)